MKTRLGLLLHATLVFLLKSPNIETATTVYCDAIGQEAVEIVVKLWIAEQTHEDDNFSVRFVWCVSTIRRIGIRTRSVAKCTILRQVSRGRAFVQ
jgi:hypothetical protein